MSVRAERLSDAPGSTLDEELADLEQLLDRAVALIVRHDVFAAAPTGTVAGSTAASLDDYVRARTLLADLRAGLAAQSAVERRRIALNADLRQLAFHLRLELDAADLDPAPDVALLARSFTFLKRHLVRLEGEYVLGRADALSDLDRALVDALACLTDETYRRRFASRYASTGRSRPFVDKLHRDYALTGYPDGLLLALADLAARDDVDVIVCALRGALALSVVLDLLGVEPDRLRHARCGRTTGSQFDRDHCFEPIDFDLSDVRARRVLILDNNVATGATLAQLSRSLSAGHPARIGFFCDYILTDIAGLDREQLRAQDGVRLEPLLVGPFPAPDGRRDEAAALAQRVLDAATRRLTALDIPGGPT